MINYHTYHNSQLSILNSQLNKLQFISCRGKLRRLWRPAVATHPPIAGHQSEPCVLRNFVLRRVLKGHVSIRNPLQAPKERSCGISITSSSLGSAKRDPLSSSTSYGMRQSTIGELYIGGGILCTHSSYSISLLSKGAWLRRDAIASYDYPFLLCNLNDGVFYVLFRNSGVLA